jgi:choline-sulfatase
MLRLLTMTLAILSLCQSVRAYEERPNILFLFADDLPNWAIHSMGKGEVHTPNLDRLAARGMTFTHAYNMGAWHGAVCMPSRGMLNTGRYLWDFKRVDDHLKDEQQAGRFWSQYLHHAGYQTYMAGKWHLSCDVQTVFDRTGTLRPGMPGTVDASYNRPYLGKPDAWNPANASAGGFWNGGKHWSEVLADEAAGYLAETANGTKPFFMYLAFNAPHDPRQSPQRFLDMYPAEKIHVPDNFLPEYPFRKDIGLDNMRDENLAPFPRTEWAVQVHRREFFALISHLDQQIGRVLDALEKSGKADNTWIFFTADHGLAVGHHGLFGKQNLFEHSVRPPFIVAGPGVPAGKRSDEPIYYQDLMPTTLDLAGISKPDQVQFQSLLPITRGEGKSKYRSIYTAYVDFQRAVSMDGWKLLLYPAIEKVQLFHLADDPLEMRDLSGNAAHADRIQQLFEELLRWQQETSDSLDLKAIYPKLSQRPASPAIPANNYSTQFQVSPTCSPNL